MDRRDFIKSAVVTSIASTARAAGRTIPKRKFRDEVELSIIGFGGIVVVGLSQEEANRTVADSFERGINYYDVAPTYGDGEAEEKLGIALKPYRSKVFLACKTTQRTAEGARAELERSLERLHTDHFDLYQFHALNKMSDVEQILAPGGAAETFLKAREQGKARYLGFSAHNEEAALALMDGFKADSVLFPVNYVCFTEGNFGPRVLARAKEKGIARLALKGMAHGVWPKDELARAKRKLHPKAWYEPIADPEKAKQALRFTLSEDITSAIPPGDEKLYQLALDIAADFKPLSKKEREQVLASGKGVQPLFRS